jgi:heme A synthase
MVATMVEFTHRLTSGVALVLVFVLAAWVFRERPKGHPARRAAAASVVLILVEAAVGAALVLFGLVAENESVARALFMAGHLANTFMLLAALALTAHWCGTNAPLRRDALRRDGWVFALAFLLLLVVGKSGAIAALGDTLYPAQSLLAGLAQDLSPTASILVRLRILHPLLAVAGTLAVAFAAARVLQSTTATAVRPSAWAAALLAIVQFGAGLLNLVLLAPVWMQIVHLLLADAVWIALVLLAGRALAVAPPVVAPGQAETEAA